MLFCENAEKIGVLFLYYYIFFPQRSQSYIFSSCCTILTIDMVLPCFLLQKAGQGFLRSRKNSRWGRRKDLSLFVRSCCFCALVRGLEKLEVPRKGFNCCGAKLRLRCVDSRFEKPRSSLRRETVFVLFALCKKNQKAHQRFTNLWTPRTIQIAGRYVFEAKVTGFHQVTGFVKSRNFAGYRRQ